MASKSNPAQVIADLVYDILAKQHRLDYLPEVIRRLQAKKDQLISDQIKVISARPLDKATQQTLSSLLQDRFNTTTPVVFEVKPELVAGLLISWQDKLIDLSIKGRLNKIREGLTHG